MSGISELSTGCLEVIASGRDCDKPVLQILGSKKISGNESVDRYRLLVSDGKYLNSFAMLASQLNDLIHQGDLEEYTIVRLDRYITSLVNKNDKLDKRILIILEITILNRGSEVGMRIGEPIPYTGAASKTTNNNDFERPAPATANVTSYTSNSSSFNSRPPAAKTYGSANSSANQSILVSQQCGSLTHPIASLSPYQNKWVIKARVTTKSPLRTWSNAKGEGKLFNMDLMDESGEIRATAFREACDKYYDMIEVDKVYYISKCQLKPANKQFSTLNNDYEMTFTNDTVVQLCEEDAVNIPKMRFEFVPISQIMNMATNAVVDIIGVCQNSGEVQTFTGKNNSREFKKREVTLVDSSRASVTLTLWGEDAVNFDDKVQPVILVKNARINEFGGGRNISVGIGSTMKINPDIPEGHKLRGWFDNGGAEGIEANVSSRSNTGGSFSTDWLTFNEARARNLGAGDKPGYYQLKAVIHIVKGENYLYKACSKTDCNKKLIDLENGYYRCEKCDNTETSFKYRLLVNMSIGDWGSNRWVTCFNETAEQILGKKAQEIGEELVAKGLTVTGVGEMVEHVNFSSFIFKLRTKVEIYGDMHRNKITVMNVSPVNHKEYNKYLIKNLQELTGIGKI